MYQSVYYSRKTSEVFVRDDKQGWISLEHKPTYYRADKFGLMKTLTGVSVTPCDTYEKGEPGTDLRSAEGCRRKRGFSHMARRNRVVLEATGRPALRHTPLAFLNPKLYTFTSNSQHRFCFIASCFAFVRLAASSAEGSRDVAGRLCQDRHAVKLNNEGATPVAPFVFVKQMVFMFNL